MNIIRTHYLDASALVKLFVNEKGSDIVRGYFKKHTVFYTTSLCFAETLGVLKSKSLKKEIDQSQYFCACDELVSCIACETIGIDEIQIANSKTYSEVETITSKYSLDIADAFQIVTLKRGFFSRMTGESRPILITADKSLASAVRLEGLIVWDCLSEKEPYAD